MSRPFTLSQRVWVGWLVLKSANRAALCVPVLKSANQSALCVLVLKSANKSVLFPPILSPADQSVLCVLLLKSSKWRGVGVGVFERTSGWLALTAFRRDHVVTEVSEVTERG